MNKNSPAIKRILADVKELSKHPSSRYYAAPLEDNMFEWHFTIRGPEDTEFEGGVYHGRILLPPTYPFKPPNIVFVTTNGRFEVGTKICLSISSYHEETWQPAWGVRTMLEALISFLPNPGAGAIGALDWSKDERKILAKQSVSYCCPICGPILALLPEKTEENERVSADMSAQVAQIGVFDSKSQETEQKIEAKSEEDNTPTVNEGSSKSTPSAEKQIDPAVDYAPAATSLPATSLPSTPSPVVVPTPPSPTPTTTPAVSPTVVIPNPVDGNIPIEVAAVDAGRHRAQLERNAVDLLLVLCQGIAAFLLFYILGRKLFAYTDSMGNDDEHSVMSGGDLIASILSQHHHHGGSVEHEL